MAERSRLANGPLVLRLYVAGGAPNSMRARANLQRLMDDLDASQYSVEVVDCLAEPMRALEDGVLVTPTLLRLSPPPTQIIVGTLSERARVAAALGIEAAAPAEGGGEDD